jgi:sphinganine-1-phosphate aldolase
MFREKRLREYQFFSNTEWNGGIYATTCIAGSRPGAVIAGTWSSILKHGRNGLKAKAKKILDAQHNIKQAILKDKDIEVCTHMPSPIFAMTSKAINSIALGEVMRKQSKWTVSLLQRPAAIHLAITDSNADAWDHFVKSVRKGIQSMKIDPSLNVNHDTAMYGLTGAIPDKKMLNDFVFIHQAIMLDLCPEPEEKDKA